MFPRLIRMGWRNLWRNPRRTLITATAIAIGSVMLAFSQSVMEGLTRRMVEQGISLLLGHVQIHASGYRPDRSIFDRIPGDAVGLATRLRTVPGVVAAAPRVAGFGLVSVGEQSAGADLVGIVPDLETSVTTWSDSIIAGRMLRNSPEDKGEVLIGERLARTLGVGLGSSLIVLTQAADGSLGNDVFSIAGIFRTGLEMTDGGLVFMTLGDLQKLLALGPTDAHEIAVRAAVPAAATELAVVLRTSLRFPGIEVAAWPVLAPEVANMVAMSDSWLFILYAIVFVLAAIAVLNTMLMAVFERLREFGVLTALGMRPRHVVLLVVAEVGALAVVSLGVAALIGAPLLHWIIAHGIDLRSFTEGFTMSGVAIEPVIRGAWAGASFLLSALALIGFALVAGLYPAVRASRVNPATLTRGELR